MDQPDKLRPANDSVVSPALNPVPNSTLSLEQIRASNHRLAKLPVVGGGNTQGGGSIPSQILLNYTASKLDLSASNPHKFAPQSVHLEQIVTIQFNPSQVKLN